MAVRFCARWTSSRGLRDLETAGALQKVLRMFSVASATGNASTEHAHILLRHLEARPVRPQLLLTRFLHMHAALGPMATSCCCILHAVSESPQRAISSLSYQTIQPCTPAPTTFICGVDMLARALSDGNVKALLL